MWAVLFSTQSRVLLVQRRRGSLAPVPVTSSAGGLPVCMPVLGGVAEAFPQSGAHLFTLCVTEFHNLSDRQCISLCFLCPKNICPEVIKSSLICYCSIFSVYLQPTCNSSFCMCGILRLITTPHPLHMDVKWSHHVLLIALQCSLMDTYTVFKVHIIFDMDMPCEGLLSSD